MEINRRVLFLTGNLVCHGIQKQISVKGIQETLIGKCYIQNVDAEVCYLPRSVNEKLEQFCL